MLFALTYPKLQAVRSDTSREQCQLLHQNVEQRPSDSSMAILWQEWYPGITVVAVYNTEDGFPEKK
ncbi:hypothetical protein M513_10958 [Trichuris suis]|uniref:Uncharacterized protein n=1 Tax=Trichuris suis TaxID=68888 RepID=A0A085LT76_9BILA|nr:hypothetical protein M513_10958 [Trichuris suis]